MMTAARQLCKKSLHRLPRVHSTTIRAATSVENAASDQVEARPYEEIPGPSGIYQWPIIGTMLHFKPFTSYTAATFHKLLHEMCQKYGTIFRLTAGKRYIVLSDPKDFETVFRNEGRYPWRPAIGIIEQYHQRKHLKMPLTMLQGEEWHALRTPVNRRLMKADSATYYLEPQNAVADDFVKILESRDLDSTELADLFYRFASESIGVVTFNKRLGYLDDTADEESTRFLEAARSSFVQIIKSVTSPSLPLLSWFRNSTYREFERATDVMRRNADIYTQRAKEILQERKEKGTLNPDEPNLLLSLASEKSLAEEDVSNTMLTLYSGGTDSTAKNLQVLFYNLAKHPDKQEALRKEIFDVLGPDGTVTSKALAKMVYLKACLKESFRLHYPIPSGTSRVLPVEVVLSGYKVPAGKEIMMFNPWPAKQSFDDPEKYLPERWLRTNEDRKQDAASNMIVLPFSHGPRNCAGRRFAVQEIYLATAKVLQKLKIDLEPESWDTQFMYTSFIEPEKPLKFQFKKL